MTWTLRLLPPLLAATVAARSAPAQDGGVSPELAAAARVLAREEVEGVRVMSTSSEGGWIVATGIARIADSAATHPSPRDALVVAEVRARRELTRYLTGTHHSSRTHFEQTETRDGLVHSSFEESAAEEVTGLVRGAIVVAAGRTADGRSAWVALACRAAGQDTSPKPPR